MKILWCVTGAGQFLYESIEAMNKCTAESQVTLVLSKAGYEVCRMYGLLSDLEKRYSEIILECNQGASSPVVGRLSQKEYDMVLVAPCTANTAAKIVSGIADSLASNIVAQAGKCKVPVVVLPTDAVKKQKTKIPVTIDHEKCKRCNACNALRVCPNDAIYVTDAVHIDLMKCDACLRCVSSCNNKALEFGKEIDLECRDIDVANAKKTGSIKGITIITSPAQLNKILGKTK
jgi:dihydromethanopterin reductase (acceptor)